MDARSPYAVSKLALGAKEPLRPGHDCGFYVKYFFLFLSLIQFLIILGLVLFMVYGSPSAGCEKHIQGLTTLLKNAEGKGEGLAKEVGELKRRLNTSQAETTQARRQVTWFNSTLRHCQKDKDGMSESQKNTLLLYQFMQECCYSLQIVNMTCPAKVASLEDQLKVLQLQAQLARDNSALESRALREKADQTEKDKRACQLQKLQAQTREDKYRELESKVVAELEPARQGLVAAVDRALASNQFGGCYHPDISAMREACLGLGTTLQNQVGTLARQVELKVREAAQENGRLQGQKEACAHELQERERQAGAQRQQDEREKRLLQEAQEAAARKAAAELQKTVREKEDLRLQLEQSKQACLRTRFNPMPSGNIPMRFPGFPPSSGGTNPFASFPGNPPNVGALNPGGIPVAPNPFGQPPPWPRPGQPSSGSQGSPSHADRMRLPETKKDTPAVAKIQNQPPVGNPRG